MGFVYEMGVGADLTIEGNNIRLVRRRNGRMRARLPSGRAVSGADIDELARRYIESSDALAARNKQATKHLKVAKRGAKAWNRWRHAHPHLQPMFAGVDFSQLGLLALDKFDFSYANFTQAVLKDAHLRGANFHQAILAGADLSGAQLQRANFCRADLYETTLSGANLTRANLQGVQMVNNRLYGTTLKRCTVYGASAWDLKYDESASAAGDRVLIKYKVRDKDQKLWVRGLDMAAFLYSTLNNKNISRIVGAAAKQWVLILGRFTKRKKTLEAIRKALAKHFIPIIFDFPKTAERDVIEQLIVMAGLSRFVVVEITDPRSAALELHAIVTTFGVPVFPVLRSESETFGMFSGLSRFRWVNEPIRYRSRRGLVAKLEKLVIQPELKRHET